jgi:hypothetical protein
VRARASGAEARVFSLVWDGTAEAVPFPSLRLQPFRTYGSKPFRTYGSSLSEPMVPSFPVPYYALEVGQMSFYTSGIRFGLSSCGAAVMSAEPLDIGSAALCFFLLECAVRLKAYPEAKARLSMALSRHD